MLTRIKSINFLILAFILFSETCYATSTPTVTIDSIVGSSDTITINYTAYDTDGDSVTTFGWQYSTSTDSGPWYDISHAQIGNNSYKSTGTSYITWCSTKGINNLDGIIDDSVWFRFKVLEYSTPTLIIRYDSPSTCPRGLTWDGSYIWTSDIDSDKIYKHNMDVTLSTAATYDSPSQAPYGLAWDGINIWSCDVNDKIYKHNMDGTLSVAETYTVLDPIGINWDGANFWTCDNTADKIYKHNMDETLSVAETYNSPGISPTGLVWIGSHLWSSDSSATIYKHNIGTLSVMETYNTEVDPYGLGWDGENLWFTNFVTDKICKYSIGLSSDYDTSSSFAIDNNEPPTVSVTTPSGEQSGDVIIDYTLSDTDSDILSFFCEYSTNSGVDWSTATVSGSTSGITIANYSGNITWQSQADLLEIFVSSAIFKITPSDSYDTGISSSTEDFSVNNPLFVPTGFSAGMLSTGSIRWEWTDNSNNEGGYYVCTDTHGRISSDLGVDRSSWTEEDLNPNTLYSRCAEVYNAGGSSYSNIISSYTPSNIPNNVTISSVTYDYVELDWTGDGTRYAIERSTDSTTWDYVAIWDDEVTSTNYQDTSFIGQTTNWYRIYAYNGDALITNPSTEVSTITLNHKPQAPTNSSPANGSYITNINPVFVWSQFSDSDGDPQVAFQIQLRISTGSYGGGDSKNSGEVMSSSSTWTPSDWNLNDGISYYWKVRVKDNSGSPNECSEYSTETGFTVDTSVSSVPKISSESHADENLEYCNNSPVFSWTVPSDPSGIAGYYYIFNQVSNTVPTAVTGTYITRTSASFKNIDDGTYYLHIVAKDNLGHVGIQAAHYKIGIKTIVNPNQDNTFIKKDGTKVEIPAGAIENPTKLNISVPDNLPTIPYDPSLEATSIGREFKLADGTKKFKKDVTITFPYTDSDVSGMDEDKLRMFWWNSDNGVWGLVKDSKAYPDKNKVVCNTDHFSIFAIMEFTLPTEALSGLSNYPNPFIANKEQTKIRYILKDDADVEIEIFDLLGDLVLRREFNSGDDYTKAGPNEFIWDGKDGNDNWVAAGAYICRVKAGNKTEIVKIGVK